MQVCGMCASGNTVMSSRDYGDFNRQDMKPQKGVKKKLPWSLEMKKKTATVFIIILVL